jgi:hypothetical protein
VSWGEKMTKQKEVAKEAATNINSEICCGSGLVSKGFERTIDEIVD